MISSLVLPALLFQNLSLLFICKHRTRSSICASSYYLSYSFVSVASSCMFLLAESPPPFLRQVAAFFAIDSIMRIQIKFVCTFKDWFSIISYLHPRTVDVCFGQTCLIRLVSYSAPWLYPLLGYSFLLLCCILPSYFQLQFLHQNFLRGQIDHRDHKLNSTNKWHTQCPVLAKP
jgi:hypothetical protein